MAFNLFLVNSPQLAAKHLQNIQLNTPSACGWVVFEEDGATKLNLQVRIEK